MLIKNKDELTKFLYDFACYLTGFSSKDPAYHYNQFDEKRRYYGCDWPKESMSMIGVNRMLNVQETLFDVIERDIPGDFIETGVWRGGACIFAATILKMLDITDRRVWVCDSFEGLPKPDPRYQADKDDTHYTVPELAISLETVQENFKKFDLVGDNIRFVKGWFCDTLPTIDTDFAVIRLDGDMYGSTIDALTNLYPKLSTGGYAIIDDYGLIGAKLAVDDYRRDNNICSKLITIDEMSQSCYWKK